MVFAARDWGEFRCRECGTGIDLESLRHLELCHECEAIELEIRRAGNVPLEWLDGYA